MKGPLNFASRPFGNEIVPVLLTWGLGGVLVVATIAHAGLLYSLTRGGRSRYDEKLQALAAEEKGLRKEAASLRIVHPAPATISQWRTLKDLVDRRAFPWTGLFSRFEATLPAGVRLSALAPSEEKGATNLVVNAIVARREDGIEFLKKLQESGDFAEVYPISAGEESPGAGSFALKMRYLPRSSSGTEAAP
jgi:hypothetical protein